MVAAHPSAGLVTQMAESENIERLLDMVRDALAEADRQDNTLAAALLAQCEDVLRRQSLNL